MRKAGVGGWEGDGGGGWEAECRLHFSLGHRQWCCVFSRGQIATGTIHRVDRGGHQQQVGTLTHILINAIQKPHRLCSAPLWFYRVGKKPSVKADLAIFSHVLGTSGQC